MVNYSGRCNMCGKCCKCVPLSFDNAKRLTEWKEWLSHTTLEEYERNPTRELTEGDYEMIFIATHLVEITLEEAKQVLPNMNNDHQVLYKCTALVDNKCSKYSERPRMCSQYPNYKNSAIELINKIDCGYYIEKSDL